MPDGMCYVMLGRSERLQDIFIKCNEEFDMSAIRCNQEALSESKRLEDIFEKNKQEKNKKGKSFWKISYLNIRSLIAHHEDLSNDNAINDSDVCGFGETWLKENETVSIKGFSGESHFANFGKGKGQASFTKMDLLSKPNIFASESCSAIHLKTNQFDVVFLYLSNNYDKNLVQSLLNSWIQVDIPTIVMGDINENFFENSSFKEFMSTKRFQQMIEKPTHIKGSTLDHIYINQLMSEKDVFVEQNCCYYSDHDIISLYVRK